MKKKLLSLLLGAFLTVGLTTFANAAGDTLKVGLYYAGTCHGLQNLALG